jgi:hypothetical protein
VFLFTDDLDHSDFARDGSIIDLVVAAFGECGHFLSNVDGGHFGECHPQGLILVFCVHFKDVDAAFFVADDEAAMEDEEIVDFGGSDVPREWKDVVFIGKQDE